jgi:hypothetical protein
MSRRLGHEFPVVFLCNWDRKPDSSFLRALSFSSKTSFELGHGPVSQMNLAWAALLMRATLCGMCSLDTEQDQCPRCYETVPKGKKRG